MLRDNRKTWTDGDAQGRCAEDGTLAPWRTIGPATLVLTACATVPTRLNVTLALDAVRRPRAVAERWEEYTLAAADPSGFKYTDGLLSITHRADDWELLRRDREPHGPFAQRVVGRCCLRRPNRAFERCSAGRGTTAEIGRSTRGTGHRIGRPRLPGGRPTRTATRQWCNPGSSVVRSDMGTKERLATPGTPTDRGRALARERLAGT
jgi:hypothetical protein